MGKAETEEVLEMRVVEGRREGDEGKLNGLRGGEVNTEHGARSME